MNQSQLESLLRVLLAAGGPVAGLLANWGLAPGAVNNWLTILLIVIPPVVSAIWGQLRHTDSATVLAAKAVPGAEVVVDPAKASVAVTALAADPAVPGVNIKGA